VLCACLKQKHSDFHSTGAGTPHGHRNLRRALKGLCENADLPALTLYDLRRTTGSLLVDAREAPFGASGL
jgi:integrase